MIRAEPAHAELLAAMHARCFPDDPWDAQAMREILAMPGSFGFFDERGFAIGYVAADSCDLATLGVLPEARRKGAGRALLEALCAEAKRRGAVAVVLEVAENNTAARNLYAKSGFSVEGFRKNYYRDSSSALLMRRRI
ncbi:MAG: GNAT family N-acetyltransferase [Rhodospirillales bacterium]|nr:GNAT family N-acetyltransferase [Rhodospirillales bacterium]